MSPDRIGAARVFIASSTEGLKIAEAIHDGLERRRKEDGRPACNAQLWDDAFRPTDIVIDRLLNHSKDYDFAVLVITPDDLAISRSKKFNSPRDNINLEIGLFMATLGRERCIVVRPRNCVMKMPSDLMGLCPVDYDYVSATPDSGDLRSIVNTIANYIEKTGPRDSSQLDRLQVEVYPDTYTFNWKHDKISEKAQNVLVFRIINRTGGPLLIIAAAVCSTKKQLLPTKSSQGVEIVSRYRSAHFPDAFEIKFGENNLIPYTLLPPGGIQETWIQIEKAPTPEMMRTRTCAQVLIKFATELRTGIHVENV